MNILILTAYAPILHTHGGAVRMYHNIRILAEKHRVHLISFVDSDGERERMSPLEEFCESVKAVRRIPDFRPHWFSVSPFLVREFSTPEMYRQVESAFGGDRIDVLQCEYLQMAQFWKKGTFTILTAHETLSANAYDDFQKEPDPAEKFRRFYRWMANLRYETLMTRRFDRTVTMTEHDAEHLRSYSPGADIRAIPIGIDTREFTPHREDTASPLEVLFIGNFRHSPNLEAAEFLVSKIAPRFPDVDFLIAGSHLPLDFVRCPNVRFPGYISDTRKLYKRPNTIVIAPLFSGTGQRVKLLEAFAMGCPVVATPRATLGFPVTGGMEAMIAKTPDEFATALSRLACSIELRRQLGAHAREMIIRYFDWDRIGKQFLELVEQK